MKKILFCFILNMCLISCFALNVCANDKTLEIEKDFKDYEYEISGSTDSSLAEKRALIVVFKADTDIFSIDSELDEQKYTGDILYCAETELDSDGNFSFDGFAFPEYSGDVSFQIKVFDSDLVLKKNTKNASVAALEAFKTDFNTKNQTELKTMLDSELQTPVLGIDLKLYSLLSESQRQSLCSMIVSKRTEEGTASTVQEVYQRINNACAYYGILHANNANQLVNYFISDELDMDKEQKKAIETILKISEYKNLSTISKFLLLSKNEKAKLLEKVPYTKITSEKDIYDAINSMVVWQELESLESWNGVNATIAKYIDVLDTLDYTKYKQCRFKSDVDKSIVKAQYMNIKDLCNFINELVKNTNNAGDSGSFGGLGGAVSGGGSGGGSGGSLVGIPQATNSFTNSNKNSNGIFTDLKGAEWARTDIVELYEKGVISGKEADKFYPNDTVTREEFVKMIVCAFNISGNINSDMPFTDVDSSSWSYEYVKTAYESGIINGIDDTHFGLGTPITRQDMAVLLSRILENVNSMENTELKFADSSSIDEYAVKGVSMLSQLKVIAGYEDNTFKPRELCTRAQAARVINSLMKMNVN